MTAPFSRLLSLSLSLSPFLLLHYFLAFPSPRSPIYSTTFHLVSLPSSAMLTKRRYSRALTSKTVKNSIDLPSLFHFAFPILSLPAIFVRSPNLTEKINRYNWRNFISSSFSPNPPFQSFATQNFLPLIKNRETSRIFLLISRGSLVGDTADPCFEIADRRGENRTELSSRDGFGVAADKRGSSDLDERANRGYYHP